MSEILTAISTVGFPIVACGFLAWYTYNRDQTLTAAINNMTIAISKLETVIEDHFHKEGGADE